MAGREKIMVYSYNFKGSDARIYGSQSDFRDFMYPVMKGSVKNVKREFNLKLPEQWI